MEAEIYAKLVSIEQLLMIVLGDPKYADGIRSARASVHREYGERLKKLFPSDPEYGFYEAVQSNFDYVADMIEIEHRYSGQ